MAAFKATSEWQDIEGSPARARSKARLAGRLRPAALLACLALTVACGGTPAEIPTPTAEAQPSSSGGASSSPEGDSPVPVPGGFDITRVRLMDAADLPDGIPVPVPLGGEIDESVGAFEGQVLAVEYDPRFISTAAAFYATWIEMEGLEASPLMSFSDSAAGWEVIVDGRPVQIQVSLSPDGAATQLAIYWE